ncbi:MAG TPA: oligosaccharide flippase family protein [Solirubrobacteraceae bacterium]|nr:oligosaccharide flippase family protein [Solirubrobacteraceae bacterium]
MSTGLVHSAPTPSSPQRQRSTRGEIARSAATSIIGRGISAALTAALILFLVRELSAYEYGIFALAVSISELLILPADAGLTGAAARFIAEQRDNVAAVADLITRTTRLKFLVMTAIGAVLAVAAGSIARAYALPGLAWPLRVAALAGLGESSVYFSSIIFMALRRAGLTLRLLAAESVLEFTASVALVLSGARVVGAIAGRAIGYVGGATVGWLLMRPYRRRRAGQIATMMSIRTLLRYAAAVAAVDLVTTSLFYVDVPIIAALLGPRAVAIFQAPLKLTAFLALPAVAVAQAVAPNVARSAAGDRPGADELGAALRVMSLCYAFVTPLILVWADPVARALLGTHYASSGEVIQLLTPYVLLLGAAPLLAAGVTYLGAARRRVPFAIAALAVNVTLDFLLLPAIGVIGASLATDAGFAVAVVGNVLLCRRELRFRMRPLVATGARAIFASAVVWVVLNSLGGASMSLPAALISILLSPVIFIAAAALTGERVIWQAATLVRSVLARSNA